MRQHPSSVEINGAILRFVNGFEGATASDLERLRHDLGIDIPSSLQRLLAIVNGGHLVTFREDSPIISDGCPSNNLSLCSAKRSDNSNNFMKPDIVSRISSALFQEVSRPGDIPFAGGDGGELFVLATGLGDAGKVFVLSDVYDTLVSESDNTALSERRAMANSLDEFLRLAARSQGEE
jgi:hypothetical protein